MNNKNHNIGIVLPSLFLGFFAYTGFYKALEENKINPDVIIGCSAGALVGSCMARKISSKKAKEIIFSLKPSMVWNPSFKFWKGINTFDKIKPLIEENLRGKLKAPNYIITTDKEKWETKVFEKNTIDEICASMSVPGIFKPVLINKKEYVDGAFTNQFPLDILIEKEKLNTAIVIRREKFFNFSFLKKAKNPDYYRNEIKTKISDAKKKGIKVIIIDLPHVFINPFTFKGSKEVYEKMYEESKKVLNQANL